MPIDGTEKNARFCTEDGAEVTGIPEIKCGELIPIRDRQEVCIRIEITDDIDLVTIDRISISRKE